MASGVDTYTHTHTHIHILWRNESDFKKPGVHRGRRAPGLKIAAEIIIKASQK